MSTHTCQHRSYLLDHAITDDVIEDVGIRTVTSWNDLTNLGLAHRWPHSLVQFPAICFPWLTLDGRITPILRPDTPVEREGKPMRYVGRTRERVIMFAPSMLRRIAAGCTGPLVIIEGVKQTLAGLSHVCDPQMIIVGINGIWGWVDSREDQSEPRRVLPDLADLIDTVDRVILVPDSDWTRKPRVYAGVRALADLVPDLRIAQVPGEGSDGLDDRLAGAAA